MTTNEIMKGDKTIFRYNVTGLTVAFSFVFFFFFKSKSDTYYGEKR